MDEKTINELGGSRMLSVDSCDRMSMMSENSSRLEPSPLHFESSTKSRRSTRRGRSLFSVSALVGTAAAVATILLNKPCDSSAFQIMTMSLRPRVRRASIAPPSSLASPNNNNSVVQGAGGVTSSLISQLAIVALQLRLKQNSGVECNVQGKSADLLLKGKVGPVTVRGKGWGSPLGLTCRAIEATVGQCDLDLGSIVSKRKLRLTVPAKGEAMIALTAEDFGNFITHPLMKAPAVPGSAEKGVQFCKEGVVVDPETGSVIFMGTTHGSGDTWRFTLSRGTSASGGEALVVAEHATTKNHAHAGELSNRLTDFFNFLVFELDGTFLSFRDLMVTEKGGSPSVMIALSIVVKKFPSPGLAF